MNRSALLVLALGLLGATPSPTPLVTGSIRDQSGAPIEGARVRATLPDGSTATTSSGPDGTFVLNAQGVQQVVISCRYCSTQTFAVAGDQTVVAIVRRYNALLDVTPSAADIAALPYGHIESDISLQPFQVLNASRLIFPGSQVSDYDVQQTGGLVIAAGIPVYDIVTNLSPFVTFPQRYMESATVYPQSEAFRYGDIAAGGTYLLDPVDDGESSLALGGGDTVARLGASNPFASGSIGYSSDDEEQRRRLDAGFNAALGAGILAVNVSAAANTSVPTSDTWLDASFSGARVAYEETRAFTLHVEAYADRGLYDASYLGSPIDATWSDAGGSVTVSSNAAIAPFVTLGVRQSSGDYEAPYSMIAPIAALLGQSQMVAGVQARGEGYAALAGVGDYTASFNGGSYENAGSPTAQLATPVLEVTLAPAGQWSLEGSVSGGFKLPTLLGLYGAPAVQTVLGIDRDSTAQSSLEYSDGLRFHAALAALTRTTTGPDAGHTTGVGGSLGWQLSPTISVRAWLLRVSPEFDQPHPGALTQPANVGSLWFTYQNESNLRVDAIWRQDLLDSQPEAHVDASVSGPLGRRLRWFVGTEVRAGTRYTDIGVRFGSP